MVGMKIKHKKFGIGTITDFIQPKEYEDGLMNNYVNIYGYVPKNDGIYVVQFDDYAEPKKFHKNAMYTFLIPVDETIDEDTGEIIE